MNENFKVWAFSIISWLFGIMFLIMGLINIEVNSNPINLLKITLILVGFTLLIFPFISKIKIGNIIELERKIEKQNEEITEFKSFITTTISILSTNVNSIKNNVKFEIHFPTYNELRNSIKQVEEQNSKNALPNQAQYNKTLLLQETGDKTWALLKNKIDIEKMLRALLGKTTTVNSFAEKEIHFFGFDYLINKFIGTDPERMTLKDSFDYYRRIVNAVIHGQNINEEYIDEAIDLGVQLKTYLENASK